MSVQQFCLRWNNHQPNFISVCSSLLHNGTLVDVTLAAEGKHLQAHKIVLSACSAYFQTLFTTNPCQHPIVILKDVQYNDLKTMVDFMYYGEVNVSQEQLPQILKTAEMLKIKGLAEMPDAAASLTKSESKSSSDQSEQLQGAAGGGGNGGGSDSIWGSTESQQFQTHHHHHQTQQTQSQQQQQHHHHHHHQQQQQQQQQHQHHHSHQRRSPSPSGAGASPATRRKRLRKSSTGVLLLQGSSERTSGEEQHQHGSIDGGGSTNINLSQMNQMSFGGAGGGGVGSSSGTNIAQTIHTKIIKESSSTEADIHPHDSSQESIDEATAEHHHVQQIKPEIDISSVQQSLPIDISGPGTPSDHDTPGGSCTQSQPSHTEKPQSRSVTPTSVTSSAASSLSPAVSSTQVMGTKRNRFLIRQPRIKRESDAMNRQSPEVMEFDLVNPHGLLTVPPPKIERHASEPAPTITPSSPHLLSVPQSTPFLMKQHSHPLLPSQSSSSMFSSGFGGSYGSSTLHRQLSHPLSGTTTLTAISGPPLTISSSTTIGNSPPPTTISSCSSQTAATAGSAASSDILTIGRRSSTSPLPIITTTDTQQHHQHQHQHSQQHENTSSSFSSTTFIPQSSSVGNVPSGGVTSASGLLHFVPVTITKQESEESSSSPSLTIATTSSTPTLVKSASTGGGQSPSVVILQESLGSTLSASTSEHVPTIRTKSEELLRSVSSPQATRELSLDNPNRSSHCPVIRPGPALGCNFCWNTIDAHGRILRRKTKYHCPECQTNLCIVPCFQEYHERQSSSSSSDNLPSTGENAPLTSSKSLPSAGGLRHYPKTGSI